MSDGFSIKLRGTRGSEPAAPAPPIPGKPAEGPRAIKIEKQVEDRYHRLRLIQWWDQKRLADAVIVVGGCGALGNEV